MRTLLPCLFTLLCTCASAQEIRWAINPTQSGVVWNITTESRLPHADNVEMSGRGISAIIHYSIDTNRMVSVKRELIYPQMRPYIKDTDPAWWATYRNYLRRDYTDEESLPKVYIGNTQYTPGPVDSIGLDGTLRIYHQPRENGLRLRREFIPDPLENRFFEVHVYFNDGPDPLNIIFEDRQTSERHQGDAGEFITSARLIEPEEISIPPGGFVSKYIAFQAEDESSDVVSDLEAAEVAYVARQYFVAETKHDLQLETPEPIYNTMFSLAKVRGAESIFDSKLGLVHSPGGGRYYVGFWANDQAEYINPFFPYLGYELGNEAALNMWRVYQRAIPEDGSNIRYSFEMAGESPVNPLDRGDAAMIAYGLSHYLLALGDEAIAEELWPLLSWCLDYNHKMLNEHGVVASDSDEMEGRIETGNANLSTSSLYYAALETSISLAEAMDRPKRTAKEWAKRREVIAEAIEKFFGRTVEGLDTYRYYDGHENLRHWICLPLVAGLHDRKDATLEALFDRLWTDNGVAVEKNHPNPSISKIFWDRGTLYALRGAFIAGGTERAHERLLQFSRERLLGERVPYVVEAYPEGSMAHLSAESGLYCRIFTEGLFGMLPTGFRSFRLQPRMPEGWDKMALRRIHAFGQEEGFDVEVERKEGMLEVRVTSARWNKPITKLIAEGESVVIEL